MLSDPRAPLERQHQLRLPKIGTLDRLHIPIGIAGGAAISWLATRAGVNVPAQGLNLRDMPRGTAYGFATAIPIALVLAAGPRFGQIGLLYQEERITNKTPGRAAYDALLRIPLGTALPEELIFRGALLGALLRYLKPWHAATLDSVLFGLWHIAPTMRRLKTNPVVSGRPPSLQAAWVALSVVATAAAGLLLCGLRFSSRSIVAPWMAHSAANAAGFAGARFAAHSTRRKSAFLDHAGNSSKTNA